LSADGVLGLDYKINGAPLNLALDWIPRLELTPTTDFRSVDIGLAIRITFKAARNTNKKAVYDCFFVS
jgi:hypothetical protein